MRRRDVVALVSWYMLDGGATYIRHFLSATPGQPRPLTMRLLAKLSSTSKGREGGRVPSDLSVVFLQPKISHPFTPTHLYKVMYVASIFVGPLISAYGTRGILDLNHVDNASTSHV